MYEVWEVLRPGKEHYSEDIKQILASYASPRRCVVLVFPPGIGKTRSLAETSIELLARTGPLSMVLQRPVRAVHVYEPTHFTLLSFAKKVREAYLDALMRGYFTVRLPIIFILKGSIFSCVNSEHVKLFREAVRTILSATRLSLVEGYRLLEMLEVKWRELAPPARVDIVKKLTEYSLWTSIEVSISYLCQVCPYRSYRKFRDLLSAISSSGVDIVDTEAGQAQQLIQDLVNRGLLRDCEVCLYRAVLDLSIAGQDYADVVVRPYLICLTHAIYANPALTSLLEARYSIVTHTGRVVRQVAMIDEVDYMYMTPPEVEIPIHLCPHVKTLEVELYDSSGRVRKERTWLSTVIVRNSARKFTLAPNLKYIIEILSIIEDFWDRAWREVITRTDLSQVERVVALSRLVYDLVQKIGSYPEDNLEKALEVYRKWREGLADQLKRLGTKRVTPLDLVCFSIVGKVLSLFKNIRKFTLWNVQPTALMSRVMTSLLYKDVRNFFKIELDTRLGIARVGMCGISIPLHEHALRLCLDPEYPFAYLLKVGTTATFSRGLILSLLKTMHEDYARKIAAADTVVVYGEAPYINVHFYRAIVWVSGDVYERLVKCSLRELPQVVADISREREELMLGLARKIVLQQPTMQSEAYRIARQYRKMLHFATDIFLNTVHEIASILYSRNWLRDLHRVAIFTGTKAQMINILRDLVTLSELPSIRHGFAEIKIRKAELDRNNMIGRAIVNITYGGKKSRLEILIGHARGRLGRGIDLDEYDVAFIIAPPLTLPTSLKSYLTRMHYEIREVYQRAATSTEQALFRVVRRLVYDRPKVIIVETCLFAEHYMTYYTPTFRKRLEYARLSPCLEKLRLALSSLV